VSKEVVLSIDWNLNLKKKSAASIFVCQFVKQRPLNLLANKYLLKNLGASLFFKKNLLKNHWKFLSLVFSLVFSLFGFFLSLPIKRVEITFILSQFGTLRALFSWKFQSLTCFSLIFLIWHRNFFYKKSKAFLASKC